VKHGFWRLTPRIGEQSANSDAVIAKIAARQHGVVGIAQLRAAGLGRNAVTIRLRAGRLHRLHRAVYAVGHARISFEGRCMAAVLACGEGTVISHRSAGALWGMLPAGSGPIEVTVSGDGGRRKRRGIATHRSSTLTARHTARQGGIPITKPARTLRDLHRSIPQPVYQRAVRRALDLRLISSKALKRDEERTRSELERMMLRLCRRHRLPLPEVNARVDGYEVDFQWREERLIVETDSFRHHGHRSAFESDRARDAHLQALGYRVLRFTHRQIERDPHVAASALRSLLGRRQERLDPDL
jgi:very-short-patch-repair endonuclease